MSVIDFDVETALNGFGALIFVVEAGVVVGLTVGLAVGLTVGFTVGLAVGLTVGLVVGLAVGFGVLVGVMTGDEVASAVSILFGIPKVAIDFSCYAVHFSAACILPVFIAVCVCCLCGIVCKAILYKCFRLFCRLLDLINPLLFAYTRGVYPAFLRQHKKPLHLPLLLLWLISHYTFFR